MPKEVPCIKVQKVFGEKAITLANKLKISNKDLTVQRNSDFIYIPFIRHPLENELQIFMEQFPNCEILTKIFPEKKKPVTTYADLLVDRLPPYLLACLPHALDFVGDIAIIEIPPELEAYKAIIGEAILKAHKNVQTVLAKASTVTGTYRLREYSVIAGKPKTETIHKEHGCRYHVDLAKAYFSPRLSHEHKRVASLVNEGETIIDMFAGVGPFTILIAKTRENMRVYAVDANPNAIELLKRNIRLNRVEGKVHPILGDAKQVVNERLVGVADRVIMNLPEKSIEFLNSACKALKPTGGVIHFYSFVNTSNSLENMQRQFASVVEGCGWKVEKILLHRFVRETAPYQWQAVLDAKIIKP
ncbi:MAG: class I SAM-dependent methyltransferase family protein [Candidatus Bathyarchaeia archaeon]